MSLALWFGCGFCAAYAISVMTRFVRRTPTEVRGQVVGLGASGLIAIQGVGSILAGLAATAWSPAAAIGAAGAAGLICVALLFTPLRRAERTPAAVPQLA